MKIYLWFAGARMLVIKKHQQRISEEILLWSEKDSYFHDVKEKLENENFSLDACSKRPKETIVRSRIQWVSFCH